MTSNLSRKHDICRAMLFFVYDANQRRSMLQNTVHCKYAMIMLFQQSLSNLIISLKQMDLKSVDQENIYLQSLACLNPHLYECHRMQH